MSSAVPPGFGPFVDQLVAEGIYRDQDAVVAEGLRLLQKERFLQEVQKGFDEIAQGRLIPADQVFANAKKRVEEIARGEE
jgi:putative addiction module CopG family antidote